MPYFYSNRVVRFFCCMVLVLCAGASFAQCIIKGKIADSLNAPVPYAAVGLLNAKDSTLQKGALTDEGGAYTFTNIKAGAYLIKVSVTGYAEQLSLPIQADSGATIAVPLIHILGCSNNLKGVSVVADKPFMERQADKIVFNIENNIIATGNNALEVLKKLPEVNVDENDNIQVRGKSGVLIMIDGRTSYMSTQDVAAYLKSLDASQIEKIEVITNPSSKYDAAGQAVINIVLKKDKNLGFNGQLSLDYNQGFYAGVNGGITANYRLKKWNFFGGYHSGDGSYFSSGTRTTNFSEGNVPGEIFDNQYFYKFTNYWNYARLGADFTPTTKQTLGFLVEGYGGTAPQQRTYSSNMYGPTAVLDSTLQTNSTQTGHNLYITYDLNYKFKIDTNGQELSADVDYAPFSTSSARDNLTQYYDPAGTYLHEPTGVNSNLTTNVIIWAGKVDYTLPLGKNTKLEVGAKSSFVATDNNAQYWDVINGVTTVDTFQTNHFTYSENIYAGYFNFSQKLGKNIDFQLGLRGEETQAKGTQFVHDSVFKHNYFTLFPSSFLEWRANQDNSFNLSYTRRIYRPDYEQLNPFAYYSDPYNYNQGNPDLQPLIMDNIELDHTYKQLFNTSVSYSHFSGIENYATFINDSTHVTRTVDENLSNYDNFEVVEIVTLHPFKWLTSMNTFTWYYDHYYGDLQGGYYNNTHNTWEYRTLNTITMKKNWSAEVSFYYRSENLYGVWLEPPYYYLDAGIKKRFANDRGTITLNCSDILWTNHINDFENYSNVNVARTSKSDSRRIYLTLTWKLGKSQYQREEKQKGASEELQRANKN